MKVSVLIIGIVTILNGIGVFANALGIFYLTRRLNRPRILSLDWVEANVVEAQDVTNAYGSSR